MISVIKSKDTVRTKALEEKFCFQALSENCDVDEVTLDGRLFHTPEAATGNARSPMVGWHVDGTTVHRR